MSHAQDFPPPHQAAKEADVYENDEEGVPLDDTNEVTLSVVTDGPRICFAAYNEDSREIWIEDCLANGYEVAAVVERVILLLQPTLILVSKKIVANPDLLTLLTSLAASSDSSDNHAGENSMENDDNQKDHDTARRPRSIPYQALKSSTFDVRSCKALILQKLMVQSISRQQQRRSWREPGRHFPGQRQQHPNFAVSRYHAMASIIDLESTVQVQALGSLLSYLERTLFPTAEGGYIVVKDIVHGNISLYMNVSPATLSALHIFATERH
eukprot:scaffold7485_cov176-Amphora_coffeaeformis.AAC.1